MSGIAPVMLHRSWETLSRLPKGCVACPRCKAVFPDNEARYWRWVSEHPTDPDGEPGQWLCRRRDCMAEDRSKWVEPTTAWEDETIERVDQAARDNRTELQRRLDAIEAGRL